MNSETSVLKWMAAAAGVILACFCLGYFVLGPKARPGDPGVVQVSEASGSAIASPATQTAQPSVASVVVEERTEEIEAKRRKAEEERKKKEAEEAKKKAEEEAKKKAEEEAKKLAEAEAAANATPTPDAAPTPDAEAPTPDPANPTPDQPTENPTPDNGGEAKPVERQPTPIPATPPAASTAAAAKYHVRVGSFGSRDAAKGLQAELAGRGYSGMIVQDGDTYRVQIGAYGEKKNAETKAKELRANGYDVDVKNKE